MSALHRFLVEFDLDAPATARVPLPAVAWLPGLQEGPAEEAPECEPGFAPECEADPVPSAAEAIAEAVAAALAEAEAVHEAALAELAARQAAELAATRARWAAAEGDVLAEGFRRACATLGEALVEAAAAALEPVMDDAVRALAIDDLRSAIGDLVVAGAGGAIAVAGPGDLLAALSAALARAGIDVASMDFTPSEAAEVTVTADSSTIETRLGAWSRALRRRLDGGARQDAGRGDTE